MAAQRSRPGPFKRKDYHDYWEGVEDCHKVIPNVPSGFDNFMRHVFTEAACQHANFSVVKNYCMGLYHLVESWRKWLLKKSLREKKIRPEKMT